MLPPEAQSPIMSQEGQFLNSAFLNCNILTWVAHLVAPVTPKTFVCAVHLQFGPHPEALSLFVTDGEQRYACLFG